MVNSKLNTGHEIVYQTLYGPVKSRRFGTTYGINLMPVGAKICSFDCVYCQLGWTKNQRPLPQHSLPQIETIIGEVQELLKNKKPNDFSLVISGNGEPTLYPDFLNFITTLIEQRNQQASNVPIICFTNGTMLHLPNIFRALSLIDECCLKLDPDLFFTNQPNNNYDIDQIITQATQLNNLIIQACLFEQNTSEKAINEWLTLFEKINPKRVDLYTLSRKTPDKSLKPLTKEKLIELQEMVKTKVSCKVTASV